MRFLGERGAVLVAASDTGGTLHDPRGIDIAALTALKKGGRSVVTHERGEALTGEAILDVACDIWIPAARPDVINEGNAHRLNTKLIVEGANIPATEAAERRLHQRGILCVPDFIANAGGVICAAIEYHGGTQSGAFSAIEEKLRRNTDEVLGNARERGVTPREAAVQIASRRVRKAMAPRRWGVF